jgi:hypothetical protein
MGLFTNLQGFHCQMLTGGMPFSLSLPINECVVPKGINGAVAIWITSDDQPLNGGVVDRQSNAVVAGPLMTFIDVEVDIIGESIRKTGSSGNSSSSSNSSSYNPNTYSNPGGASSFASTTTVSPSDAAGIIASGSGYMSMPSATPSASSSAPNNVIANGVSTIPKPTASSS